MRAVIFAVVAGLWTVAQAQPIDPKDLYAAASVAMDEARYADAIRDFTAAYELTKDPVLFFKIGSAHEKAGDCPTALTYYKRYLAEAKPAPRFVELTNDRIAACTPTTEPAVSPEPTPEPAPVAPAAAPAAPAAVDTTPSRNKDVAWLFVGGALTFATAGAVLVYSTGSAEQDIKDLYVSTGSRPPTFDADTRRRYDALVTEGERYELLSYAAWGLASACAIGATIFFVRDARDEKQPTVTPVITPSSAGVSVRF